jgi:uncharacterized membrane protein
MSTDPLVFGLWTALAVMTIATYLCRIAGFAVMAHVPMTSRVRRGLEALPGAIIAATLVPSAVKAGWPGVLAVIAAIAAKRILKQDIFALMAGLAVVMVLRRLGF